MTPKETSQPQKLDSEETPSSTHQNSGEKEGINVLADLAPVPVPPPESNSNGEVPISKLVAQLTSEMMKVSMERQKEIADEINKEKKELQQEWEKLRQKFKEEQEERERFKRVKDQEIQEIEAKKREIEAIAKSVKDTHLQLREERKKLEEDKKVFVRFKEELNNSKAELESHIKHEHEVLEQKHRENEETLSKLQVVQAKPQYEAPKPVKIQPATFAEKVESQVKLSEKSTPKEIVHRDALEDISPIIHDSSISDRKESNNLLNFKEHDEFEVPLDPEETKRSPKDTVDVEREDPEDEDQLEKLVAEETALYDPSYYICNEIFNFDKYINEYKVFQVIRAENPAIGYIIVG